MSIKIKSKKNNFRRCGMPHPDTWVTYPDDRFTKDELAILKKEPMLIVSETVAPMQSEPKANYPRSEADGEEKRGFKKK
jgi:hypothetical protein